MNTIVKIEHVTTAIKLGIVLPLSFFFLFTNIQAQETISNTPVMEKQADLDWEALNYAMSDLGNHYQAAVDAGVLEMKQYEDTFLKKSSRLAKAFFDNYPQDRRHNQALYLFFNAYAEPHFIPEIISDSLIQLLASIPRKDRRIKRLVPIDTMAMEQWSKTGDAMVKSVLNSNAPLELKEAAEFQLISREFHRAVRLDNALTKEKSETDYWNRFEIQYWKHICLLLENHVNKYAALEVVASRVNNILTLLKIFSTAASDAYWNYFFETTSIDNPLADQPGIKVLHTLSAENVAAIKALKVVNHAMPLDMAFTAMDGTKVDIANMQGKVILIDFWATYCGPCIKEMPHVRALYDKYRDQGFEVIGIAADNDSAKDRVMAILNKTGANWPQRLDRGSEASVSFHALYKITQLPTVWLLNKEGVIVDRDARGERLEPLIRKYLGSDD